MRPRTWFLALMLIASSAALAQTPPPETPPPPQPPPAPPARKLFVGGGIGFGFGDVDWIEIAPLISYRVAPRVDLGGGVSYRYRNDKRYTPSYSANDWGASVFGRVAIYGPLFGQAEFDYDNYEYPEPSGTTTRSSFSSFLAGAGVSQPLGRSGGVYMMVLYNFNYDAADPRNPYASPWVYRVGAGVTF